MPRRTTVRRGFASFLLDDALLQDDICVDGALAGLQDAVARLRLVIEAETLVRTDGACAARIVPGDDGLVLLLDGNVEILVAVHLLHQHDGMLNICVERDDRQNGVQQLGHAVAVGADEHAVVGLGHRSAGEVAVVDSDAVAVPHLGQDLQKLGREDGGNVFQHDSNTSCLIGPPVDFGRQRQ